MIKVTKHKTSNGDEWAVWKGRKMLRTFDNSDDAHKFASQLAEDAKWNASNRD